MKVEFIGMCTRMYQDENKILNICIFAYFSTEIGISTSLSLETPSTMLVLTMHWNSS